MIRIVFGPFQTFYVLFGASFLGAATLAGWLWLAVPGRWRRRTGVAIVVVAALAVMATMCLGRRPDWDETEHIHSAWLMSQHQLPFRDFWEHHSPLLWMLLAPLVGALRPSPVVCDLARVLSLLVSAGACFLAVRLAQRLHASRALVLMVIVLWAGVIEPGELYNLRPDLFANVCALAALVVMTGSRTNRRVLASGALLGLGAAFTPKYLPLVAVLPFVALTEQVGPWVVLRVTVVHWLGVVSGIAPLVLWLRAHGLAGEFVQWVYRFNQEGLRFGGGLPFLLLAVTVMWAVKVRVDRWSQLTGPARIISLALAVSLLMFFVQPFHKLTYGLQLFMLVAAAAGAGEAKRVVDALFAARRPGLAGFLVGLRAKGVHPVLVGLYFLPTVLMAQFWCQRGDYWGGRDEVAALIRAAGNDPVVAVPPGHPLFARDATDLSQPWQWNKWLRRPEVRERLAGMVDKIIITRPSVILGGDVPTAAAGTADTPPAPAGSMPARRLEATRVISEEDATRLQAYLEANYTLIRIQRRYYWLRNDRPYPPDCELAVRGEFLRQTPTATTPPVTGRVAGDDER